MAMRYVASLLSLVVLASATVTIEKPVSAAGLEDGSVDGSALPASADESEVKIVEHAKPSHVVDASDQLASSPAAKAHDSGKSTSKLSVPVATTTAQAVAPVTTKATTTAPDTETSTTSVTETETVTQTVTATSTSTKTATTTTRTATTTTGTTTTKTQTTTVTSTSTVTTTTKTTTSSTVTSTTTTSKTTTSTTITTTVTSTTTTTAYCFEDESAWEPLDMAGTVGVPQKDEWACQDLCAQRPGCSHFTYGKHSKLCHLQDAFSMKYPRPGFRSGPFQCWEYIMPGVAAEIGNNTFVPEKFRCMQVAVTWFPSMGLPKAILGKRDEIVLKCQERCKGTSGCEHFTVEFPNICKLADKNASPLPALSDAISGPAISSCDEPGYVGHTFMKKNEATPFIASAGGTMIRISLFVFGVVTCAMAFVFVSRRSEREGRRRFSMADVELTLIDSGDESPALE